MRKIAHSIWLLVELPVYALFHPRRTWEVLHDPEFHAIIADIMSTLPPLD